MIHINWWLRLEKLIHMALHRVEVPMIHINWWWLLEEPINMFLTWGYTYDPHQLVVAEVAVRANDSHVPYLGLIYL